MSRLSVKLALVGVLLIGTAFGCTPGPAATEKPQPASPEKVDVKIMASSPGGDFFAIGSALAKIWGEQIPGFTLSVMPGGAVANIEAVESGKSDMGFSHNCLAYSALRGLDPFKQPAKHVRFFASLTVSGYHLAVRADSNINAVSDLKGRKLATLTPGNIGEYATREVLDAAGLTYQNLSAVSHGSFADGANQLRDGHVDAYSIMFNLPASPIMELSTSARIALVSLEPSVISKVTGANPGYKAHTLPAGYYPKIDYPVSTFATRTNIVVSDAMPEDLVYRMAKAFAENVKTLAGVNAAFEGFTARDLAENPSGLPYHEGALRYYREVGAAK